MRKTITRTAAWALTLAALGVTTAQGQTPGPLPPVAAAPPVTPTPAPPTIPVLPPVPAPPPAVTPAAKFVPRVASHQETEQGKALAVLTINETEVATIRTIAGGFSPQQRAEVAVARLNSLLPSGLTSAEVVAKPATKPLWDVEARGGTLLLATPDEADAHGHMSPEELARAWVKALRKMIDQPSLTLAVSSLIVPLGETRTVKVGGAALPDDIQVANDNASVSLATFDPVRRLLTVRGHAQGHGVVALQLAPGTGVAPLTLPVSVMKYAGQIGPAVTIQVTGIPAAPPDLVTEAAYAGLTRALSLEDGAAVTLSAPPRFAASLTSGARIAALFPLHLSGPDLLPVTAQAAVNIVNTAVAPQTPGSLFYSNNPEQVKHTQTLFTARLRPLAATRLDYHHQNMSGGLLVFHVDLLNDSDTPASVQVIAGLSQPGGDTVQVGRRAGAAFLKNLDGNVGLVLPVPPHGRVPLVTQRFAPGLTVSGLMQLQSLAGGPLTVRVSAGGDTDTLAAPLARVYQTGTGGSPLAAPSEEARLAAVETPSPYVFARPQVTLSGKYVVNQRWTFVPLGDKDALRDATGKIRLYGNYGADYQVALTLSNPTPEARQVGVYFVPGAGPAAGVFQVDDGPILEYDPFEPPNERELALFTLAPGETRVTHLRTIPLNGSAYPAQLVARALDKRPTPALPPVAAAVALTAPSARKAGP